MFTPTITVGDDGNELLSNKLEFATIFANIFVHDGLQFELKSFLNSSVFLLPKSGFSIGYAFFSISIKTQKRAFL